MSRAARLTVVAAALLLSLPALAQTPPATPPPAPSAAAPAQPLFATTKVEGTDNVYIFRFRGAQSMFVVTPTG